MKEPYVKVSASFILKDAPKKPGMIREDWTFGKQPMEFCVMAGIIIVRLSEFYMNVLGVSTEAMAEQLKQLVTHIQEMTPREEEIGATHEKD